MISRIVAKLAIGVVVGTSIALSGVAVAANAAALYDDINYGGYMETADVGNCRTGFQ